MAIPIQCQEKDIIRLMAKEFLEYRLGIKPTSDNIHSFASHIVQFEKEVAERAMKRKRSGVIEMLVKQKI